MDTSTGKRYTSAFTLFRKSVNLIKDNFALFAFVSSVPLLTSVLSTFNGEKNQEVALSTDGASLSFSNILGVSLGMAVVILVLGILFQVMAIRLQLDVANKGTSNLGRLWEFCRQYFFKFVGLAIILGLSFGVGLLLLIVPGLIVLTRFYFAPYVMINENLGIIDSLKRSNELAKGNAGAIWSVIGVTILLAIIPAPFGNIGSIVATLLAIAYSVAPALRYFEVSGLASEAVQSSSGQSNSSPAPANPAEQSDSPAPANPTEQDSTSTPTNPTPTL